MKFGRKTGTEDETGASARVRSRRAGDSENRQAGKSASPAAGHRRGYLDGQMLIAMPTMGDERFSRAA